MSRSCGQARKKFASAALQSKAAEVSTSATVQPASSMEQALQTSHSTWILL